MVRLLRLFMIVMLLLLLPLAASAQIVEVDGYGDDKESAMKDAKRNAAINGFENAEFYVGEIAGTNIYFKISAEFYFKRWFLDCSDGGT